MSSTAIMTVVKMMENLPDSTQIQVVDHLREYLADLEDEALWDEQFARSQPQLTAAAQKARQEIQETETTNGRSVARFGKSRHAT
jgi:hypothetical protein